MASLVLSGYLVGSLPFAFLLARRARGIDLRAAGSGNVGAANVLRTTTLGTALAVVALDIAKGALIVWWWARAGIGADGLAVVGVSAIVGHIYPVWLGFRGGKGVATSGGVFLMLAPQATALAIVVFVGVVALTRYVSLGSVFATSAVGPVAYMNGAPEPIVVAAFVTAGLLIFRHRSNLSRLYAGTERRLGQRA